MTRQEKRRAGYFAHQKQLALEVYLAKQLREQTGAQEKWNRAVTTCRAGVDDIIMLDNLTGQAED